MELPNVANLERLGFGDEDLRCGGRERLGHGALLAPEVAVVVEADAEAARAKARDHTTMYLAASNYVRNLKRLGSPSATSPTLAATG